MPAILRNSVSAGILDGASTSLTIPVTTLPGEFMVLVLFRGAQLAAGAASTNRFFTPPAGWFELNSSISGSAATTMSTSIMYKTATGADQDLTITVANSAATQVMQLMHLTTWDSSGLIAYSSSIGSGNGTAITWPGIVNATQRVGDTMVTFGAVRSNHAAGYNNITYPTGTPYTTGSLGYNSGVASGQILEEMFSYGTIPTAKLGSALSGTSQVFHNSRSTYVMELGPSLKKAVVAARAYFYAVGSPVHAGNGKPVVAKAAIKALAEPPPTRKGYIFTNARMAAAGKKVPSGHGSIYADVWQYGVGEATIPISHTGTGVEVVHVSMAARGYAGRRGQATMAAKAKFAAQGIATRGGRGVWNLTARMSGRGVNSADVVIFYGSATLTVTVGQDAAGQQFNPWRDEEILYSTVGYTQKGITVAPGIGVVPAGTVMTIDTVDKYAYPYHRNGLHGRDTPVGVLRRTCRAGNEPQEGDIVIAGNLRLDALTSHAIATLVQLRGAITSIGRNLLRF